MSGTKTTLAPLASLAAAIVLGCSGHPFPLAVHQGSSFILPFSGEALAKVGYGLDPEGEFGHLGFSDEGPGGTANPFAILDGQRGQMLFVLCQSASDACTPDTGIQLVTRLVTRIGIDRASIFSVRGAAQSEPNAQGWFAPAPLGGQVIAIMDVPIDVPAQTYSLRAWIQKNESAELVNPFGAGDGTFPIEILPNIDGPEEPTPFDGQYGGFFLGSTHYQMLHSLPLPKLILKHRAQNGNSPGPAAAELTLEYPKDRVIILGGYEENHHGQGSMVRVHASRGTFCLNQWAAPVNSLERFYSCLLGGGDLSNRARIDLLDLDRRTRYLSLVFWLVDPDQPVDVADFSIVDQILYDDDGNPIPQEFFSAVAIR